jgi:GTP-binding protein YchF
MLLVGIIGLPNVGKSTLFNALTASEASVSNYPFTTIDSNEGMVAVPDGRLEELNRILEPQECTPCFIQFIDIAGLVEGASKGEGLGNQFLGSIREVDTLAHVVRCFGGTSVSHVLETVDPLRDVEVVETELLLADLDVMSRAIEKRQRLWKTSPRDYVQEQKRWLNYQEKLDAGVALAAADLDREDQRELKGLGLLTGKPVLYVANLSEEEYPLEDQPCVKRLAGAQLSGKAPGGTQVVAVLAQLEWELQQLEDQERVEFIKEMGLRQTGLERVITSAFTQLGLITFYTIANEKLRAWEVEAATLAPEAAGKIHSDMEQGFIRAQVASFEEIRELGSFQGLHRLGKLRTEGKDYQIQDGDVVQFVFNP